VERRERVFEDDEGDGGGTGDQREARVEGRLQVINGGPPPPEEHRQMSTGRGRSRKTSDALNSVLEKSGSKTREVDVRNDEPVDTMKSSAVVALKAGMLYLATSSPETMAKNVAQSSRTTNLLCAAYSALMMGAPCLK
jgi:hypothetical protein